MFHGMHDRGCGPRRGMHGQRGQWERLAAQFVDRWEEAQRGRGGRRGRMFDGGELRLLLLKLIADEPRHGYDLIRRIEELTGGAYAPSPGVVYPTITLLDEMGMIAEQQSEGAKKRFAATDEGHAHLAENAELVEALMARLTALADHRDRADNEAARRAMRNLGEVVRGKLRRDEVVEDTRYAIIAMIDEVAQKIERLK